MFTYPHLQSEDLSAINEIIGRATDLLTRPGAAVQQVLIGLQELVCAEAPASILFAGSMAPHDSMKFDYRGRVHHGELSDDWIAHFDWRLARGISPVLDGMKEKVATVNNPNVINVHTRPQLVDDSVWHRSPIYKNDILPMKISDQIFAWYQTNYFAVTYILRATEGRIFTAYETSLVKVAVQQICNCPKLKSVIRPENVQPPLSPQLRRVRDLLLCGFKRDEIRLRISSASKPLSDSTVAGYIKEVLRRYGVTANRDRLIQVYFQLGGSVDEVLLEEYFE